MRRLVVVLVALTVVAPSGAAGAERDLRVTAGQDGAVGSLRHLVEKVAKPGDTIVFPTALRVELRRKLTIPRALSGLTIDGSTATGGTAELVGIASKRGTFIEIFADGVTLLHLRLTKLSLVFQARKAVGPARARILGVESNGATAHEAALKLSSARDFVVRGGRFTSNVKLIATKRGWITGVTLAAKGFALDDEQSTDLEVEGNTLESGRMLLESQSVDVVGNDVGAGATIHVHVSPGGRGTVADNEVTGGRILAGGPVDVRNNDVTGSWRGGAGLPGIAIECPGQATGPQARARNNDVRGMRIGIAIRCDRDVPIAVVDNAVTENGVGIAVTANETAISGGSVRKNRGDGIEVRRGSRTTIRHVLFGENGGLAIDRADAEARKPTFRYDQKQERIRGRACVRCIVDLYVAEDGGEPGEGIERLGTVRAGGDGAFGFPQRCEEPARIAALATDEQRKVTSEFAGDATCEPELTPERARCAARFTPIGYTAGQTGATGGRVEISCAGADAKSTSISAGSGAQKIATFASRGACRKIPTSGGGPDRALSCIFRGPTKGRVVSFEYTADQPFSSTTLYVTSGGFGEAGTMHVLHQAFFFARDGMTCSQTLPRRATCATLPG